MANEMQVFYFHRGSFAAEIFYLNGGLGRRSQQNFMLLRWSMKQAHHAGDGDDDDDGSYFTALVE